MTEHYGIPAEKAEAIKGLRAADPSLSARELGRRVGTSHSQVSRILAEDEAPDPTPDVEPVVTEPVTQDLALEAMADRIVALEEENRSLTETVRSLEGAVATALRRAGDVDARLTSLVSKAEHRRFR